ncbi:MAG: ABC transporter substrate-binding protein [Clostridia bacterium]|nr:ABC transporter substrate-binding protein [Clostridia bacterium]
MSFFKKSSGRTGRIVNFTRIVCLVLTLVLAAGLTAGLSGCTAKEKIYVFNWGDYIDPGTIKEFEKEYPQYKVVYDTFDTNETMYQKLVSTNTPYDVLIPSDYMISKLISENRLIEIDYSKITNYDKIRDNLKVTTFDPDAKYTVPYMWGTLGIIYNKEKTGDDVIDSWDDLWNEKYKGDILMLDSIRDTMAIALIKLYGLEEINCTDPEKIEAAGKLLEDQKKLVALYGMDDIKDPMIRGNYAMCVHYSGDAYAIMSESEHDLGYVIPNEGSNRWIDSMVIPTSSKNVEGAHLFINFMCRTDIAVKNAEYIGYSTPQTEAMEELGEGYKDDIVYNPSDEDLTNTKEFIALDPSVMETYNRVWETFRLTDDNDSSSSNLWWILLVVLAVAALGAVIFFVIRKKKRDKLRYED